MNSVPICVWHKKEGVEIKNQPRDEQSQKELLFLLDIFAGEAALIHTKNQIVIYQSQQFNKLWGSILGSNEPTLSELLFLLQERSLISKAALIDALTKQQFQASVTLEKNRHIQIKSKCIQRPQAEDWRVWSFLDFTEQRQTEQIGLTQHQQVQRLTQENQFLQKELVERNQTEHVLESQLNQALILERINQKIRQCVDSKSIFQTAVDEIGQNFQVNRCCIHKHLSQKGGGLPRVAEYINGNYKSLLGRTVPVEGNPHAQIVLLQDQAVVINNVHESELFPIKNLLDPGSLLKSILVVRTSYRGQVNGVLALQQYDRLRTWLPEEIELIETLASQIGIALAHAALLEQEKQGRSELAKKNLLLKQAMQEAEVANLAKSKFLASMSHELRTPLTAILGFTQLIQDSQPEPEASEHLQIIQKNSEHLLSLINDILDMSKIEAGQVTFEQSKFDLRELLKMLQTNHNLQAKHKSLNLSFHLEEEVPRFILTDQTKLRQILENLLSNAIKFTPNGSVLLQVTSQLLINDQELLTFKVVDTGFGFTEEEMKKVFQPFVQTQAGKASHSGTGLGLSISRSFAKLMKGTLILKSKKNEGSQLILKIPVQSFDKPNTSKEFIPPKSSEQKECMVSPIILIADDNQENRQLLKRILLRKGFKVLEAVDGQDAVKMAQEHKPDLICMDMRMPNLNGDEATKEIIQKMNKQAPPIIALTANAFDENRKQMLRAGCVDFISKPFRIQDLLCVLQKYIPPLNQNDRDNSKG